MDSPRPRLPWEVIERAIDHSRGRSKTLRSIALTCRQLLARTRLVMFVHVRFDNRDHVFAFVEFLQENSHLMLIVHSITVWPSDLAPFPLLHILPNLREIKFSHHPNPLGEERKVEDWPAVHQSSLTCFARFGTHVQTLHLSRLRFQTIQHLARILETFGHVTHLVCDDVDIHKGLEVGGSPGLLEVVKRRLSERMANTLKALTIDYRLLITSNQQATSIGQLLLGPINSSPLAIESLAITRGRHLSRRRPKPLTEILIKYQCNWSSLRSLTLQLPTDKNSLKDTQVVKFLEDFRKYPSLKDVTLELRLTRRTSLNLLISDLFSKELDDALLRFTRPQIILALEFPLLSSNISFRLDKLRKCLPMLSQRGGVSLQYEEGPPFRHNAGSNELKLRRPKFRTFVPQKDEDKESAAADSSTAGDERTKSELARAPCSNSRDSGSIAPPALKSTMVDDVPTSSAWLSDASLTVVGHGARTRRGWPRTRKARGGASSAQEHADGLAAAMTIAQAAGEAEAVAQPYLQTAGDEEPESAGGLASARLDEPDEKNALHYSTPPHPRRDLSLSAPSRPRMPFARSDSVSGLEASEFVPTAVDDSDAQTGAASPPPDGLNTVEHEAST